MNPVALTSEVDLHQGLSADVFVVTEHGQTSVLELEEVGFVRLDCEFLGPAKRSTDKSVSVCPGQLTLTPADREGQNQRQRKQYICLLVFYVLAKSKLILGWVPTWDSAHSWRIYNVAALGNQAASTMT